MRNFNRLGVLLKNSGKYERFTFQAVSVLSMAETVICTMFALGLDDIINHTLSKNDLQQLEGILASIVSVSIISIVFFKWILNAECCELLSIRKQFTFSLLFMGTPKSKVANIYIFEWIKIHLLTLFIGCLSGGIFYGVVARILNIEEKFIPLRIYLIAVALDTLLSIYILAGNLVNSLRGNVVDNTRNTPSKKNFNNLNPFNIIIRFLISFSLFLASLYIPHIINSRTISELSNLLKILALIVLLRPIVIFLFAALEIFAKKMHLYIIFLSVKLSQCYFNSVKIPCLFIILSCSIFTGLYALFNMFRISAKYLTTDCIKYEYFKEENAFVTHERNSDNNTYYGIKLKAKSQLSHNIYICAIDSLYIDNFEKINLASGSENATDVLKGHENSILVPDIFGSPSDIGNLTKVNIAGKDYEFKVVSLYHINNFSEIDCFVNINYLKSVLNLKENEHNIVYFKDKNLMEFSEDIKTKIDVVSKSVDKVVSGTENVEAMAYILIFCAIISMFAYYSMISKSNEMNILRFRAMGMKRRSIMKIYVITSIHQVLIAAIFTVPVTLMFTYTAAYTLMDRYYFMHVHLPISAICNWIILMMVFSFISIVLQIFYVKKFISRGDFVGKLRARTL